MYEYDTIFINIDYSYPESMFQRKVPLSAMPDSVVNDETKYLLDDYGKKGWELVSVVPQMSNELGGNKKNQPVQYTQGLYFFLKRKLTASVQAHDPELSEQAPDAVE